MKKTFLMTLCLLLSLSSYAYDFKVNGYYYNILSITDRTAQLTCSGPSTIYGDGYDYNYDYKATYNGDLEGKFVVPKTVEYEGVTFTVTSINYLAFINCVIGTLIVPETILEAYINAEATNEDYSMVGIWNLIVEDSETPIMLYAPGIKNSVYLGRQPSNDDALSGGSYTKIEFGENVTRLNHMTCYENTKLTSVTLPKSIKYLDCAFRGCSVLKTIDAPGVEIAFDAFLGCHKLETVNMPMLRYVGDSGFGNCTSLKSISFSPGLLILGKTYHGGNVFEGCSNLESVVIPSTVVRIGREGYYYEGEYYYDEDSRVFADCSSLKTITMCNPVPINLAESNFAAMTYLTATLKVPVGAAEAYRNADVWKNFVNIVEDVSITDDIFTVAQEENYSYGGSIEIEMEDALPAYDKYRFAKKGKTITIKARPDMSHKLMSLTINGVDVTEEVHDNVYQTTVAGGMMIAATFEYDYTPEPEPEPIYLTIQQAEGGSIRQQVSKWSSFAFYVEPSGGWKLHSVMLNDKDITSQVQEDGSLSISSITENTLLSIAFEEVATEIDEVNSNSAKVYAKDGCIVVSNAEVGEPILIYNEAGINVASKTVTSSIESIDVEKGHVYVVKLKNKTVKVAL